MLNSACQTRTVIIIRPGEDPFSLHLELGGWAPNLSITSHTHGTPPQYRLRKKLLGMPPTTHTFDIGEARKVNPPGALPAIPYLTISDVHGPNTTDITFSANELPKTALHIV